MVRKLQKQPLPLKTFEKLVGSWAEIVDRGESALVHHYARTDLWWRMRQLEETRSLWEKIVGKKKWPLIIDVVAMPFEEGVDVLKWLTGKPEDRPLFVLGGERLLEEKNISIWAVLASEARTGRSVLVFTHRDVTSPEVAKGISGMYELAQGSIINPLYSRDDARVFVEYLSEKWGTEIPKKIREDVIKLTGGHFALVKQLLRVWRDTNELPVRATEVESIRLKLGMIWETFDKRQKGLIKQLAMKGKAGSNEEGDVKRSLDFLVKTGWLVEQGKNLKLMSPLLEKWLEEKFSKFDEIKVNDDLQLTLSGVVIDWNFSRQERKVLRLLIRRAGEIVTREDVGRGIWGLNWEEKYSDWAIDRLISRLRTKLRKIGLGSVTLQTKRGRGYVFN